MLRWDGHIRPAVWNATVNISSTAVAASSKLLNIASFGRTAWKPCQTGQKDEVL
jgi:hypothetical protein